MKSIIKTIRILITLMICGHVAQAQNNSQCSNLDFSQGTFNGWICRISTSQGRPSTAFKDLIWTGSTPVSGRHTIMTNINGYDQHTCNGIPNSQLALVPDGFNQSARVGNDYTMYESDAIIYQMTVDTNNALMLLHFCVVFNDPQHSAAQQPCFELQIQDSSGNLVNIAGNRYYVISGASIPGFIDCGSDILWRDWTTAGVSLFDLIGQTIYIIISTADCGQGGHFGYGYVVGECRPMEIQVQYCEGATVARLEAPEGFVSYVWRGPNGGVVGNSQKLSIQNPTDSVTYIVTMQSAIGSISTLSCVIEKNMIAPDYTCDSLTNICFPTTVHLAQFASASGSDVAYWDWNISKYSENQGTEYVSGDSALSYTFQDTGLYKILLTVYTENGCADTSSVIVYSYPNIDVNISGPSLICKNTETEITASGANAYEWTGIKRVHSDSSAIIDQAGIYIVKGINNIVGCAYDTIEINDIEYSIQYTSEDNKCLGDTNGKINITGIIGDYVIPVKHYWEDLGFTNGASLSQRNNLPAGSYVVYSIDDLGCFRYDTIIINDGLSLGSINPITGDSIIQQTGYYNYTIDVVQEADAYHWWADEITLNGNINLLDTITVNPMIVVSILNTNPVKLNVMAFNTCDSSDTSSLTIQMKNNIMERIDNNDLSIFPNPTSDQLNIESKHGIVDEITLFDVVGKVVLKQSIHATDCTINLNDLHNGLYFIRIKTENTLLTYKILKK